MDLIFTSPSRANRFQTSRSCSASAEAVDGLLKVFSVTEETLVVQLPGAAGAQSLLVVRGCIITAVSLSAPS